MYPSKKDNIYPYSEENINAILNHYFDIPFGELEWLFEQREWTLNQVEFVAGKVAENLELLQNNLGASGMTVSNLMRYGIDATFKHPYMWRGSKNRVAIIKLLNEAIYPVS